MLHDEPDCCSVVIVFALLGTDRVDACRSGWFPDRKLQRLVLGGTVWKRDRADVQRLHGSMRRWQLLPVR